MFELDNLYFRVHENSATVFRVDTQNRQDRLNLIQIATLNLRNETIKPNKDETLTDDEIDQIKTWIIERKKTLERRETERLIKLIDEINETTHWVQRQDNATKFKTELPNLFLALHDLRNTLLRVGLK